VRGKLSSSAFAFPRLAAASREENLLLRVIRRPLFAPLALALLIASAATWSFQEHWDAKPLSADQLAHIREGLEPNPAGGFFLTARLNEGLGEKQLGKLPFLGEVFILTDGATFSTAADFCAVTHHLKRAVFIGEETAGAYYGNNSGTEPTVTLPHSKVRFGLRLRRQTPRNDPRSRRGDEDRGRPALGGCAAGTGGEARGGMKREAEPSSGGKTRRNLLDRGWGELVLFNLISKSVSPQMGEAPKLLPPGGGVRYYNELRVMGPDRIDAIGVGCRA
jgi:hypothetical protein